MAVSSVSEIACQFEQSKHGADAQTWNIDSIATTYQLSVPFKAAATAAAGSTSGLLHCYA